MNDIYLKHIPESQREFKTGLNICITADFDIAGQASLLFRLINQHSIHKARLIIHNEDYLSYDRDLMLNTRDSDAYEEAEQVVKEADFYHHERVPTNFLGVKWNEILKHDNCVVKYHGAEVISRSREIYEWHKSMNLCGVVLMDYTLMERLPGFLYHINTMIDLDRLPDYKRSNSPIRICHSPTNRFFKKTELFLKIMDNLKKKFPDIECVLIENKTNAECLKIKSTCHMLYDQISVGTYGLSAIESMAMEQVVFCGMSNFSLSYFNDPPIVSVTEKTLEDEIRNYIESDMRRESRGKKSRSWVMRNHNPVFIMRQWLNLYDFIMNGHSMVEHYHGVQKKEKKTQVVANRSQTPQLKNGKISACMIVKDEETNILRCLTSINPVVDEIIMVDTGSKDKTMDIARNFPKVKPFYFKWRDDFSAARNFSLSKAINDWIMIIDADEELVREDYDYLKKAAQRNDFGGYFFKIFNHNKFGKSEAVSPRMFRNIKENHYEGIVHNQLKVKGHLPATDIRINHYGYNISDEKVKEKFNRSFGLIEKMMWQNPDEPLHLYHLARHLHFGRKFKESRERCLQFLKKYWRQDDFEWVDGIYASLHYTLFASCWMMEDYDTPVYWLMKIHEKFPEYIDTYLAMTCIYSMKNNSELAEKSCENYFKLLPKYKNGKIKVRCQVFSLSYDHVMIYFMGLMYDRLKNNEKRLEYTSRLIMSLEERGIDIEKFMKEQKQSQAEAEKNELAIA